MPEFEMTVAHYDFTSSIDYGNLVRKKFMMFWPSFVKVSKIVI